MNTSYIDKSILNFKNYSRENGLFRYFDGQNYMQLLLAFYDNHFNNFLKMRNPNMDKFYSY